MSRITQADLEKYLFKCADILRNYVEASSYRDYIFPLSGILLPAFYTVKRII